MDELFPIVREGPISPSLECAVHIASQFLQLDQKLPSDFEKSIPPFEVPLFRRALLVLMFTRTVAKQSVARNQEIDDSFWCE